SRGMSEFQQNATLEGLEDLPHLDRYCYHVAGVVGEMLTELFCDYSPEIDRKRETLYPLAVSFGQGLQMTNILKDVWEDRHRGACWLPRQVFREAGFDLRDLKPGLSDESYFRGMEELIAVARSHLENALAYTLLVPARETGIRRFCLWALGMAVLTLRKLYRRLDFSSGEQVKITRRSVKATIAVTSLTVRNDALLRILFESLTRQLPVPNGQRRPVSI
ncbi:MAG: squalene/phytoene synthase family protein, partial [Gammaproteobacteria bacterium]|nr:squalene/phytoene synthase family protein [Gammaproteobacteria bacterium]